MLAACSTRLVTASVGHRFITVAVGLALFAASIWSIGLLPKGFLRRRTAPVRCSRSSFHRLATDRHEKITEDIVTRSDKRPEVKSVFVDGGTAPGGALRCAGLP